MKLLLISLLLFAFAGCHQEVAVTSTGGGVDNSQPEEVVEEEEEEIVEPKV